MTNERHVARDITYATSMKSAQGKAIVKLMENVTGRIRLIRKAKGYADEVAQGRDFWQVMIERYGITLDVFRGSLGNIPATGPVIVVANHPFGILDGLIMGHILSARRGGDFKVLAHRVFRNAPDLEKVILPVAFDETKEAAKLNLETRAEAVRYLNAGGAVGIFPGGTVSTSAGLFDRPLDPGWRNFTAKMIQKSDAVVVPVYFDGANSRLFQIASHMHYTLRMGMLIREFGSRIKAPVRMAVGEPIPSGLLKSCTSDAKGVMDFLRKATYDLSPNPVAANRLGFEFEAKYRVRSDGGRGF